MAELWISKINDACHRLRQNADTLDRIARSLDEVGLVKVADKIIGVADRIAELQEIIRAASADELNDSVRYAEQQTAGLLTLALQGKIGGDAPLTAGQGGQS